MTDYRAVLIVDVQGAGTPEAAAEIAREYLNAKRCAGPINIFPLRKDGTLGVGVLVGGETDGGSPGLPPPGKPLA